MLGAIARACGADPEQFRILLKTSILLDLRREHAARGKRGNPLIWMLVSYAVVGFMMAMATFWRVSIETYSFVMINLAMLNSALSVLIDFNAAILNPEDADVLGFRPVSNRTYFLARLANFVFYVGTLSVALNFFPAIFGCFMKDGGPAFGALYVMASTLACLFIACVVIFAYALLIRMLDMERVKDFLLWVQIVLVIGLMLGYQFLGELKNVKFDFSDYRAWMAAPQTWFVALSTLGSGTFYETKAVLTVIGVLATFVLMAAPMSLMSVRYAEYLSSLSMQRRLTKTTAGRPARTSLLGWFVPRSQRPVFDLCLQLFARDRQFKMRTVSVILVPLAFMAYACLKGELRDPMNLEGPSFLSMMVPVFMTLTTASFLFAVQTSDTFKAAWIFYVAPIRDFSQVVRSIVTFVRVCVMTPLVLAFTAVCVHAWQDVTHGLIHGGLSALVIDTCASLAAIFIVRNYPFSRPVTRGESWRFMAVYFGTMILAGVLMAPFLIAYALKAVPILLGALLLVAIAARVLQSAIVSARGPADREFVT